MKKSMYKILIFCLLLVIANTAKSQIGINSPLPNKFSALEVKASGKGMYFPRISNIDLFPRTSEQGTQKNGSFIYNYTINKFSYFIPDNSVGIFYKILSLYDSKIHDSVVKNNNERMINFYASFNSLKNKIDAIQCDTQWIYICYDVGMTNLIPNDYGYKLYLDSRKIPLNRMTNAWSFSSDGTPDINSLIRFKKDKFNNLYFETINNQLYPRELHYKRNSVVQLSDTLICQLPVGYRPKDNIKILAKANNLFQNYKKKDAQITSSDFIFLTLRTDGKIVIDKKYVDSWDFKFISLIIGNFNIN